MANILITGASSGLGAALARTYSEPGNGLVLWGRDTNRLEATAEACRARGATVEAGSFDVRDMERLAAELRRLDARLPLDLAFFNAGVGGVPEPDRVSESPERAQEIALVNFTAPVLGATVLGDLMAARGRGHIVMVGSMAGCFPMPMAPTYAGSKAGLAYFSDSLAMRLRRHGVAITLVAAGFIDTPMSRSVSSPKPFLMTADDAARTIQRKLARRPAHMVV
ncbi:MAG: SDR family NAD(P)-dependent oxidoreductase, partial [Variibacter sp.]|nr:SDR family NAD(P)-dependent oxidoreductase [Variibacter sp.]